MLLAWKKILAVFLLVMLLPAVALPATIYETQADYLDRAFSESPPEPSIVWLSGDRKSTVRQLLGHDYAALRLRYWCRDGRTAWILDEIGKELPITVGVVVRRNYIESLRVLTYRENRGGEVVTASFVEQFTGSALNGHGALDTEIDGITGATLSVQALTRLANMALFLHSDVGCNDGS